MVKIGTIRLPGQQRTWHLVVTLLPRCWFVGKRYWPQANAPVIVFRGFGPIQAQRYLRTDEARAMAHNARSRA
jgi:hypothetical protein